MVGKVKVDISPHAPYAPARLWSEVVYATKAIAAGEATKDQQALFFEWLIVDVCKKDDLPWFPGGDDGARDTDFANGKRFVALQVLKARNMSGDKVAKMRLEEQLARGEIIEEGDDIGRRE